MFSYQFLFFLISTFDNGNELFPTDVPEPELSMISPNPEHFMILPEARFPREPWVLVQ